MANAIKARLGYALLFPLIVWLSALPSAQNVIADKNNLASCSNGFFSLFSCPFNIIPYFAYVLVMGGFGIGYVRTKKISWGMLGGFLVSAGISSAFTLWGVAPNFITFGLPLFLILGYVATVIYELHK